MDLVERSKQRKLRLDSDESVTEEPDVVIVGVSSDVDRRYRCSGNDGRMEDEGCGASGKIPRDIYGEKYMSFL